MLASVIVPIVIQACKYFLAITLISLPNFTYRRLLRRIPVLKTPGVPEGAEDPRVPSLPQRSCLPTFEQARRVVPIVTTQRAISLR